jgi:subtilisin family serine protease
MSNPIPTSALVDSKRLKELAATGTGGGVRVAILDTGVETDHPALEGSVEASYEIVPEEGRMTCRECPGEDPVGHGTACAGIVHEHAPEASLLSVRVVGKSAGGTGEQLLYGLHWTINEGKAQVINLSLGTLQSRFQAALHELVDRAYYEGILIVAAGHNRKLLSYPSNFASLVGVDSASFEHPLSFRFRTGNPIEVEAHGVYVKAPAPGGNYQQWTGTSFAAPHVAALAARLKSQVPDLTPFEFKAFMKSLGVKR